MSEVLDKKKKPPAFFLRRTAQMSSFSYKRCANLGLFAPLCVAIPQAQGPGTELSTRANYVIDWLFVSRCLATTPAEYGETFGSLRTHHQNFPAPPHYCIRDRKSS